MSDRAEAKPRADDEAPRILGARRAVVRRGLLSLIALLYVLSVPWYRDTDAPLRIVFGLPDWVAVAVACYVAIAIFNAIAWMLTTISDQPAPGEDARQGPA